MGGLLALVCGLPFVPFLPKIFLASTHIRDHGAQFGDQDVGRRVRCVAFHLSAGAMPGTARAGKTRNSSAGSIRHSLEWSSRIAEIRPARMARRMVDLAQPVACEAVPRVKEAMVASRSIEGVRPWSTARVNDSSTASSRGAVAPRSTRSVRRCAPVADCLAASCAAFDEAWLRALRRVPLPRALSDSAKSAYARNAVRVRERYTKQSPRRCKRRGLETGATKQGAEPLLLESLFAVNLERFRARE